MVFHWSLSDSKSPQVSRTHLRILAVLSNADIWIVSTRPPTSKSSIIIIMNIIIIVIIISINIILLSKFSYQYWMVSITTPISNFLNTFPSEPITLGITVIIMFYCFLRSKYLSLFSLHLFSLCCQLQRQNARDGKFFFFFFFFFFLC